MTEEKNITHNDMRFFQNDLLNDLKKLELQLNGRVASINQVLLTKMGEYDSKFSKVFENISGLISQIAERKFDNDRIEELLKMRNKFADQIIESQSRISIIDKSLENALFKYDKIILDNLNVPGLIGVGSKYKNCASYFKYIDNELKLTQKFKEDLTARLSAFHEKVDVQLKKSEGDISQIFHNVNHICDVRFEKIFRKIEERSVSQENMIAQTRIENSKYANDLITASTDLKIQWDKLENIKNEIYGRFDEELDKYKKIAMTTERNFKKQEEEFNVFKQRFSQLAEYLKDFKNHSKNYKEMTKDIDFSKKQKLKDDFDLGKYDEIGQNVKNYIRSPSPQRKKNDLDSQDEQKEQDNSFDHNNQKNLKRSSLSPSPRKTATFIKNKKITELEKINKIAKDGNKRLSNVFSFKNKLKELNEPNTNTNTNNIVKKNLNYYYKTELKRKSDLNNENTTKGKKFIKTLKRKKTIVTENNIDLNFDENKENDKEISKEEIENSSFSSNFSLSSIISLKKIAEESKDEKKQIKSKSFKEKKEELYSDKEEKSSEIEKSYKSNKNETEKKSEENITSIDKDRNKERSEKLIQKNLVIDEIKNNKKFEKKNNEINKKKVISGIMRKTIANPREISKKKKESETQKKSKNKIKQLEKPVKINIQREKSSKIINKTIEKKSNSPNTTKKILGFEKADIKQKNINNNNVLTLNNESQNETSTDKINKVKAVSVFNRQIKQAMNEYTNKRSSQMAKTIVSKINKEVTFPQIKTKSNEINKNQGSQPQIVKLMTNTPKENRKIQNKLILGNNAKPFVYKALLTKQRINTNNNENKDTLNASFDNKGEKEKIENKEMDDINNIEKDIDGKSEKEIEKEENNILNLNENKDNNNTDINNGKEIEEKANININYLFNSLYDEIKEIKDITNNTNENKEKDNINNKNAFLTSLNQVNTNYNYFYNNNNGNNIIPISDPNQKKDLENETIKKFNNEIDFINGNIKLVNHRITNLEKRYKLILNQLNNIFKTVSTYYHHHKRKMDQHNTLRLNNKKGTIRGRSIDYQKEEEVLDDKKFMLKLKDMYNDDYENNEELRLNIPHDEYNKTLRKIEPFLIKKFKNG